MRDTWQRVALPLLLLRASGQAAEFVAWVVLARRLGASEFGVVSVAFLVCRYGGIVGDWGASIRGARDVATLADPALIQALVRRRTLVTAMLAAAFVIGAAASGHGEVAAMSAVLVAAGASRDWLALGRLGGLRASLPFVARGLVIVVLAFTVHRVSTASAIIGAGYIVSAGMSLVLNPLPKVGHGAQGTVRVDAWMLVAVVMAQVYTSVDTVLLSVFRSVREAGIYAAVYRLPSAWITVVGLLVAAAVPTWARVVAVDSRALLTLRTNALRLGMAGAVILLAMTPVAILSVRILFGEGFTDGEVPLGLIMVASAIATVTAPLGALYIGVGSDRRFAMILAAGAVLNVAANIAVIPLFGMRGAALTTVLSETVVCLAMLGSLWGVPVEASAT